MIRVSLHAVIVGPLDARIGHQHVAVGDARRIALAAILTGESTRSGTHDGQRGEQRETFHAGSSEGGHLQEPRTGGRASNRRCGRPQTTDAFVWMTKMSTYRGLRISSSSGKPTLDLQ